MRFSRLSIHVDHDSSQVTESNDGEPIRKFRLFESSEPKLIRSLNQNEKETWLIEQRNIRSSPYSKIANLDGEDIPSYSETDLPDLCNFRAQIGMISPKQIYSDLIETPDLMLSIEEHRNPDSAIASGEMHPGLNSPEPDLRTIRTNPLKSRYQSPLRRKEQLYFKNEHNSNIAGKDTLQTLSNGACSLEALTPRVNMSERDAGSPGKSLSKELRPILKITRRSKLTSAKLDSLFRQSPRYWYRNSTQSSSPEYSRKRSTSKSVSFANTAMVFVYNRE